MLVPHYSIAVFIFSLFIFALPSVANANNKYNDTSSLNDTVRTSVIKHVRIGPDNISEKESRSDDSVENELLGSDNLPYQNPGNRNALFHFLKSEKLTKGSRDKKISDRLYSRLAKVFVRMKLYPVAMQYYFKTLVVINDDSLTNNINADKSYLPANFLSFSYQDIFIQNSEHYFATHHNNEDNSPAVSNSNITSYFDDEKKAVAYAVIIHVKQPVSGRRKPFTRLNNVGHMFITLIKYNDDSTCSSRSFGFYPKKDNLLSATPIRPVTSSVFKDDALHNWDEAVGKFISRKRFQKIIRLINHYENRDYNLNNNNCTDFGLYAADVAGITINNTDGKWPLGHGNNPANAGQSILEGKFINADTGNTQGLFICNAPMVK